MQSFLLAAAAAGCVVATAAAHGTTSASVTIGPPQITLSDLNLRDGYRPLLSPASARVPEFEFLLGPAPVSVELFGNAEITADADDRVGGRSSGPGSSFFIVGDRYLPGFAFSVGRNTRVTVQTSYLLASAIHGESFAAGAEPPRTFAGMELALVAINHITDAGALPSGRGYDVLATRTDSAELTSPLDRIADGTQRRNGQLSVSFENRSAGDAVFALRGEMVAWGIGGNAPITPVPEPPAVALMLAGLAAVGAVVKRRRP